jgi:hypothetical protein
VIGGWRDPSSYGEDYGTTMALLILQTPDTTTSCRSYSAKVVLDVGWDKARFGPKAHQFP